MTPVRGAERGGEQICEDGRKMKAQRCDTSSWDRGASEEGRLDGNVRSVREKVEGKKQRRRAKRWKRLCGGGNFSEMQVMICSTFILFFCHLSHGFIIIISSAKLLRHIWRLPLNAAANNAAGAMNSSASTSSYSY